MDRMTAGVPIEHSERTGSALEILRAFAKLGVSCFGGPIAYIGYFRQEFVVRRRWLDEPAYADLVALPTTDVVSASSFDHSMAVRSVVDPYVVRIEFVVAACR
jgi:Chromate transporter